jgi:hypothetical protein
MAGGDHTTRPRRQGTNIFLSKALQNLPKLEFLVPAQLYDLATLLHLQFDAICQNFRSHRKSHGFLLSRKSHAWQRSGLPSMRFDQCDKIFETAPILNTFLTHTVSYIEI